MSRASVAPRVAFTQAVYSGRRRVGYVAAVFAGAKRSASLVAMSLPYADRNAAAVAGVALLRSL